MLHIYIDADGCPVKDEVYKVARRYELRVTLVSNSWMRHPPDEFIKLVVTSDVFDAADDWIAENVGCDDIVVASDIPLAARCLEAGARVLSPRGSEFREDDIGRALATRELLGHLRDAGTMTGGPPPFEQRDRSAFLQALDRLVHAVRKDARLRGDE